MGTLRDRIWRLLLGRATFRLHQVTTNIPAVLDEGGDVIVDAEVVWPLREKITSLLGTNEWKIKRATTTTGSGPGLGRYFLHMKGRGVIAEFCLSSMPGCCGVIISHGSSIDHCWRGRGLGTILSLLREEIARAQCYGVMLCTDVHTNTPQRKLLTKNGWHDVEEFRNPKTGNHVHLTTKVLSAAIADDSQAKPDMYTAFLDELALRYPAEQEMS